MKNFTFLKPVFTVGGIIFLVLQFIVLLLIFKYIGASLGAAWFIAVLLFSSFVGFIIANGFEKSNHIPWGFARKWWPEEIKDS